MGLRVVDYFLPDWRKPAFYVMIYNVPKPTLNLPPRADKILKADTWKDARLFASCFISRTQGQIAIVKAVSPKFQEGDNIYVTNSMEFWNENGRVMYTENSFPVPSIKQVSDLSMCPSKLEEWREA